MSSLERLMLDHSPSMMLLVDPKDLHIVMANRGACQTLGYGALFGEPLREAHNRGGIKAAGQLSPGGSVRVQPQPN